MTSGITILGSTGSIGTQTLDVVRSLNIKVHALSAGRRTKSLALQAAEFDPLIVSVPDQELAESFLHEYKTLTERRYYGRVALGSEGLIEVATAKGADTVMVALVGITGLMPTLAAINEGKSKCKRIALANKETLVTGGQFVMGAAADKGVAIIPVDSEHSAVFQSIAGNNTKDISRIILTASGGPFRGYSKNELENVKVSQALNHPNWKMGQKITIDSATLMNKGLEVIEARWLFNIQPDNIEVLIHPQSIVHSMVEYRDGSVIAQLGIPDMRIPIQLAITWPDREKGSWPTLDLTKTKPLTFELPDTELFPCLRLAYEALKHSENGLPVVLNAANEVAVSRFLAGEISFIDIPAIIEYTMNKFIDSSNVINAEEVIALDLKARDYAGGINFSENGGMKA